MITIRRRSLYCVAFHLYKHENLSLELWCQCNILCLHIVIWSVRILLFPSSLYFLVMSRDCGHHCSEIFEMLGLWDYSGGKSSYNFACLWLQHVSCRIAWRYHRLIASRSFWHSLHRIIFISHASLITDNIFHIPRNTKLNRAATTILIFGFSAGMHAASMFFKNKSCSVMPVMFWFWLMGIGIVVEDAFQSCYMCLSLRVQEKRLSRLKETRKVIKITARTRFVGYMWVWLFFSWSLPKLVFPDVDCIAEG